VFDNFPLNLKNTISSNNYEKMKDFRLGNINTKNIFKQNFEKIEINIISFIKNFEKC